MSRKKIAVFLSAVLLITLACGLLPTKGDDAVEAPIEESQLPDISGDYTVNGTNADGSPYSGEANITRAGDGYTIRWVIASESMQGLGEFDGQTYRVDWEASWGTGEAVYSLTSNGILQGTWTTDGGSGQGTEELKPK